ncbi:fimbrial assembly protein [Sporosarcina sp. JAI121]|uniref:fimbrial assembly protein n=1 Tax=Sporosarcina sp. JAI121 TaxID=2723064 RepID=UPI0015CDDBC3|nr:fimbrial assembly protein [Sporosarcina sp. JAI121]NYF25017.1 type IV pilus assembly protein PilN [Sporosarcina sp. JAI121]
MLVDINLLPEKERDRSQLLIAALAIIGAAVLLWLILFMLSNALENETETLEGQLVSLQASQEEIRSELQQFEFGDEKKLLVATVGWAEGYQFDTVPLLHELINLLPARGFFHSFDFTGPNLATVTVQFDTKQDSAYYFTRLKMSPTVSEIHLDSVVVDDSGEDVSDSAKVLPRYLATYSLQFVDNRIVAEGTAETTEENGDVPTTDEGDETND